MMSALPGGLTPESSMSSSRFLEILYSLDYDA